MERRGNSYRIQKMFNGKRYSVTFDHKPTAQEIMKAFFNVSEEKHYGKKTFGSAAEDYIKSQKRVLSPSTIRGYCSSMRTLSDDFKELLIDKITQIDIQTEVNYLSKDKAPKTVKNYYAFICSVLGYFRPDFSFKVNLPQQVKYEAKIPSDEVVRLLFQEIEGTPFSIPIKLACLGLRRSEIAGLSKDDLEGNELHIHRVLVQDENNNWVYKDTTKTISSTRTIYVPDELAKEISECDEICPVLPGSINRKLQQILKKLGYEKCRAHDLRHYYISYAHSKGMSDADIIASVGHKTDHIMKTTYRHSMQLNREQKQKEIASSMFDV